MLRYHVLSCPYAEDNKLKIAAINNIIWFMAKIVEFMKISTGNLQVTT